MTVLSFKKRCHLPVSPEEAFSWHTRPGAFERLLPPWEPVDIVTPLSELRTGAQTVLNTRIGPLAQKWVAEVIACEPGRFFTDSQLQGPFAFWEHTHRFIPDERTGCWLEDDVRFALPGGALGAYLAEEYTRRKLERLFRYRQDTLVHDLNLRQRHPAGAPLRVLVTGAHGLIGSALLPFLRAAGHDVVELQRGSASSPMPGNHAGPWWNPEQGIVHLEPGLPFDAVIHLAGSSIADRWTAKNKVRMRQSRVEGTRLLVQALARMPAPPRVMICASGLGFYGDRGQEVLTEASAVGTGFLAELAQDWERATVSEAPMRVVHLRLGMVVAGRGGAMAPMLASFRLGIGGRMGAGQQFWSWISLEDVLGIINQALWDDRLCGPLNVCSPRSVSNAEFAATLGRVLRRPAVLPLPAWIARGALGEMADSLLLASTRAQPAKLLATGFSYAYPDLEPALRHCLGRYA
jgi:uncharacterized protein